MNDLPSTLRAIGYPLTLDGNGGLALSYGTDVIRDEFRSALTTWQRERVMRQQYGLPGSLVFSAYPSPAVAAERIRLALMRALGGRKGLSYSVSANPGENGVIEVTIDWSFNGEPQPALRYQLQP